MKYLASIIASALILLPGCKVVDDATTSYNNVVEETQEVIDKVEDTKAKVDETVDDLKTAVTEIKEAKEAIDKITE